MSLFKDITDELEQAANDIDVEQTDDEEDLFALLSESEDVEVDQDLLDTMLEESNEVAGEQKEAVEKEKETAPEAAKEERRGSEEDRNAVTVITKGTTINGNIVSDCSLEVMGTINGDVECLGKLDITGKVTGNCLASEVEVNAKRLEGSIVSEGNVKIGLGTVIIGDVTASSAEFAGAVKGEIDVKGSVVLDSTAIIKGNIKAKSIQMNNGAVMDGFCSLGYAEVKIDDIFE